MEQQKLPPILLGRLELEFEGEVVCSLPLANSADKVVLSKPLSIGKNGWISRASKPIGIGESSPNAL
jgi:hypothetical protein